MKAFLVHVQAEGVQATFVTIGETWRQALDKLELPENSTIRVGEEERPYEVVGWQTIGLVKGESD